MWRPAIFFSFLRALPPAPAFAPSLGRPFLPRPAPSLFATSPSAPVDPATLFDTDVVLCSPPPSSGEEEGKVCVGVVAEGASAVHPLCAWTLESVFPDDRAHTLELLVDEEEDSLPLGGEEGRGGAAATVLHVFEDVGYGSRQVGGGKGPGNPHGEESEELFYVGRKDLDAALEDITGETHAAAIVVRPELEILW